jgi:hypothetical protein
MAHDLSITTSPDIATRYFSRYALLSAYDIGLQ